MQTQEAENSEKLFEHCGLMHKQCVETGTVILSMDHYIQELKAVPLSQEQKGMLHVGVDDATHSSFISLLGGMGWLVQIRLDVMVYIGALQRVAHHPTYEHVVRLNRVLKWVRRKAVTVKYERLAGNLRIIGVSDSVFEEVNESGLACREHVIMLGERDENSPAGKGTFV